MEIKRHNCHSGFMTKQPHAFLIVLKVLLTCAKIIKISKKKFKNIFLSDATFYYHKRKHRSSYTSQDVLEMSLE